MLGRAFQVLALAKNVDLETTPLAGFKFARQLRPKRLKMPDHFIETRIVCCAEM